MKVGGLLAECLEIALDPAPDAGGDEATRRIRIELLAPAGAAGLVDRERLLTDPDAPDPPYWAFPWGGAHAIARAIVGRDGPRADASVLDLGCGLGLAGLAAGRMGARVCFADLAPEALAFAAQSASRNALSGFRTRRLDLMRDRLEEDFEWILAADLLYEPSIYEALADFLDAHLRPDGTALVTDRMLEAPRAFFAGLAARGFTDEVAPFAVPEGGQTVWTRLHRLRRRPASAGEGRRGGGGARRGVPP